jgi:hypothetical protein
MTLLLNLEADPLESFPESEDGEFDTEFEDALDDERGRRSRKRAPDGVEELELNPSEVVYEVQTGQEYGPHWRSRRPPGLPADARLTSKPGAAFPFIEQLARDQWLGDVFVITVRHLSETESGGLFARPANTFDARPQSQRPAGKPLITAWGAFQFNRGAWQSLPEVPSTESPWESTPYDEIARPIRKYAELFADVLGATGSDLDAARGVRLWHRTPTGYQQYLRNGERRGFAAAWRQVPANHRTVVDRHLRNAGIL